MSTAPPPIPTSLIIPIIDGYFQGIRPAFAFILIPTVFGSMLVPLIILLFALSTPQTRRWPIFILNALAIGLGIIVGALSTHLTIRSILSPLAGVNAAENLAFTIFDVWLSWFAEAVLVTRVKLESDASMLLFAAERQAPSSVNTKIKTRTLKEGNKEKSRIVGAKANSDDFLPRSDAGSEATYVGTDLDDNELSALQILAPPSSGGGVIPRGGGEWMGCMGFDPLPLPPHTRGSYPDSSTRRARRLACTAWRPRARTWDVVQAELGDRY
ncbi:hypothetical protein B0H10DRAFT_2233048 [Mycena sp. CBHHK59/15]|nr:hypothetical protein B0H10DRAFT_2233048 [Mycena sp. CBHHK59/15]